MRTLHVHIMTHTYRSMYVIIRVLHLCIPADTYFTSHTPTHTHIYIYMYVNTCGTPPRTNLGHAVALCVPVLLRMEAESNASKVRVRYCLQYICVIPQYKTTGSSFVAIEYPSSTNDARVVCSSST